MDRWRLRELNEVLGDHTIATILEGWSQFKHVRCGGLKPATVNRFRDTAQAAINHAGAEHGFDVPKIPKLTVNNERIRFLTATDQERLLSAYVPHVHDIVTVLCFNGLRTGEALRADFSHADMASRRLFIPDTKTGVPRRIRLHDRVFEAIQRVWVSRGQPTDGAILLNRFGQAYSDPRRYKYPGGNPLRSAHKTALRRVRITPVGGTDFTLHDWRHHWASHMAMGGCDLPTLQRLGGWKDYRSVQRYAAVSTEHMDEAVTKMR